MSSPRISAAAVFGWISLTLGVLAVVLYGAWPHVVPSAPSRNSVVEIDVETANQLARAAALLGAGGRLGEMAVDPAQLQRAEQIIEALLERVPELGEVHRLKGLLEMTRGNGPAARQSFERCLRLDAANLPAFLALGASYAEDEDHAAAEGVFRRALEVHPESVAALNNLGQTLWLLGRQDEAMEVYRRKIEIQQRALGAGAVAAETISSAPATAEEAFGDAADEPGEGGS